MIMKWRDMERVMAPTSQQLLQGGMRTRDWFSDKLGGGGRGWKGRRRILLMQTETMGSAYEIEAVC